LKEKQFVAQISLLLEVIANEFTIASELLIQEEYDATDTKLRELIVAELQCHDIISQRIHHIIDGYANAKPLFFDNKFKRSFLDLQSFQLTSIASDLEKTVTTIKNLADRLTRRQRNVTTQGTEIFARYDDIKDLLGFTCRMLTGCVAQRVMYTRPPFTPHQTAACLKFYTMQSERIVLHWFIANMPFGTRRNLLRVYHSEMETIKNESVELFN
jgi:hypothetical protein